MAEIQDDYDSGYNSPSNYSQDEQEIIRIQLDVDREIKKFEMEVLRGMVETEDPKTGDIKWRPIAPNYVEPINELGVREILSRIRGRATTIAKLSYKTDEEIYQDMFYFDMSLTELIAKRSDAWEMDSEIAKSIKDSAIELVWDIVASSRKGFTAINLRSQYSKQDVTRSDVRQKEGKSFLGIPLGRK